MEWDPLQVAEMNGPVSTEYISYIPKIIEKLNNQKDLIKLLETIITNDMGLSYDANNLQHKKDVVEISHKLFQLSICH